MNIKEVCIEREKRGIQLEPKQLLSISKAIGKKCNFLVFGVGNDTPFWLKVNKGKTVFIEDSKKWFLKAKKQCPKSKISLVKYNTKLSDGKKLLNKNEKLYLKLDKEILNTKWDVILVDAPRGYQDDHPGRMKSIYMASILIKEGGHIFVHDCNREIERIYTDNYLLKSNMVEEIGSLRHYKFKKIHKKGKNILCDAKAFCFGPISKLLMVCELLNKKHTITFLVSGTSKILSESSCADRIIECNTEDEKDLLKHEKEFQKADIFINIMNPVSAKFAAERKIPLIQIDSLFWMWDNISDDILKSKAYFIQNFEGVDAQLKKFKGKIKNPVIVGPIVKDPPKNIVRKNKVLINLGGMESASIKVGINTQYPFVITKILDKALKGSEAVCAGNKDVLKLIKSRLPNSKINFTFFNHDAFLRQIGEAKLMITSPGLTATFEAFNAGTPVFFLPPQNFSQYWNLDNFKKQGIAPDAINWDDLYPKANLIKNEKQIKGIKKVLKCAKKFEKDLHAWQKLESYISSIANSSKKDLDSLVKMQKKYFRSLGGNGTKTVASKINKILDTL